MESRPNQDDTPLTIAYLLSVLIHIVVLSIAVSPPSAGGPANEPASRLDVVLAKPQVAQQVDSPKSQQQPARPRIITAAPASTPSPQTWPVRTWSRNERSEMDSFLNELAAEAKPQRGQELAARALAAAQQAEERPVVTGGPTAAETARTGASRRSPDAFSLEMYFDAFLTKLNRSAAFVKKEPRKSGYRKALVQILLKPDGTLKSYEVLRSGDQEVEIAYIKSVVDRATPFSAFPRDIAGATEVLSVLICITPSGIEGSGTFSRASPQECRD